MADNSRSGDSGSLEWAKWLDKYPPPAGPKAEDPAEAELRRHEQNLAKRRLPIDDELDLHGCTVEEAITRTRRFIETSQARGLRKVLVIHGKGNHSNGTSLLRAPVRSLLASHPGVGETGTPGRDNGGDGAVWAILRYR
ncbi:MAG: hypothetical protein EA428_15390 [Spirochaetaceae bacterium]|nr:MAG: hypothetical protein EA428_15390 [Spirochaetaceae bacterium]